MKKYFLKYLRIMVATVALSCLVIIVISRWKQGLVASNQISLDILREAYAVVSNSYIEKPDAKKLVKGMIDGMLATLDPHSAYIPPEPYKEMEVQMSGAFGGVGIELGMKDDRLTVIAPIEDTPAFRAGIQPNDHIWKIDGIQTRGMNISAAVKRMRGEKGTPVILTILRGGGLHRLTFNLIRDVIKVKSLTSRTLEPGYGLIRIAQFQERTGRDFRQALQNLRENSDGTLKGLVLDLRFNPGGLLGSSVEVANCFIGDDIDKTLIVSTKGRLSDSNREFHATLGEKESRYPIVVLINAGSASASEIVAGALQDHKRAIIMGRQSFGKGSVQSIFPLPGNTALKLTTAHYYTPSGRSIQARGIIPDIDVGSVKPLEKEVGSMAAIREKDLENRLAPDSEAGKQLHKSLLSGRGEPALAKDYQLSRALELLQSLRMLREQGFVTSH